MSDSEYSERLRRVKRTRLSKPPTWMVVGAKVDYCGIVGEPPTLRGLTIRIGPEQLAGGNWVVWLEGKASCVAIEAVLEAG
jgi:hypothetical protein